MLVRCARLHASSAMNHRQAKSRPARSIDDARLAVGPMLATEDPDRLVAHRHELVCPVAPRRCRGSASERQSRDPARQHSQPRCRGGAAVRCGAQGGHPSFGTRQLMGIVGDVAYPDCLVTARVHHLREPPPHIHSTVARTATFSARRRFRGSASPPSTSTADIQRSSGVRMRRPHPAVARNPPQRRRAVQAYRRPSPRPPPGPRYRHQLACPTLRPATGPAARPQRSPPKLRTGAVCSGASRASRSGGPPFGSDPGLAPDQARHGPELARHGQTTA